MVHQDEDNPKDLVPFLLDAQDELVDLVGKKYGKRAVAEMAEGRGTLRTGLSRFAYFLLKYSGDPDIHEAMNRKYREFGRFLGLFSVNYSQAGDFLSRLDEKSRSILMFLSEKGHASLDDLSDATRSTHYDVLSRLQNVIIPESINRLGKPLVMFMDSKIDPLTGERIPYSWWLNENNSCESGQIEVTEEDDGIIITAELAGSDLPHTMQASATFKHGILEVRVKKGGKSYERRSKGNG